MAPSGHIVAAPAVERIILRDGLAEAEFREGQ
jgi:hypothetical protein